MCVPAENRLSRIQRLDIKISERTQEVAEKKRERVKKRTHGITHESSGRGPKKPTPNPTDTWENPKQRGTGVDDYSGRNWTEALSAAHPHHEVEPGEQRKKRVHGAQAAIIGGR